MDGENIGPVIARKITAGRRSKHTPSSTDRFKEYFQTVPVEGGVGSSNRNRGEFSRFAGSDTADIDMHDRLTSFQFMARRQNLDARRIAGDFQFDVLIRRWITVNNE